VPKLIIHSPAGTFTAEERRQIAGGLTALGITCERLPRSQFVESTVWTYFNEYDADAVLMGTAPAWVRVVTLQIYVIAGGLDSSGKQRFIEGATAILDRRPSDEALAPVYVVINEIAEENWGFCGTQANLEALRSRSWTEPPAWAW
jgi:phenylpyruvate tautomerase PptA (4-oxalocrotonate tautomerase family)